MREIAKEELKKILENHKHWLEEDCEDWRNMRADLGGANLSGADLSGADLIGAKLIGADLRAAGFHRANLRRADFSGADLSGADLSGADLGGAINTPFIPMACPETGSFTAYKKASGKIVKLLIPENARRSSATGRKCRCDKALVLEIQNMDGTKADVDHVSSDYDEGFVYTVGETVCVTDFCEDRFEECAAGIHFFINRQEAIEYGD